MRVSLAGCVAVVVLSVAGSGPATEPSQTSRLWGASGEAWSPAGRLPDFSFAGYRCGEAEIPTPAVATDVLQHGAKGDGVTDDAEAIQRAIDATERGAVLLPPGRYVLGKTVKIEKPNVVLRGAGPGKTVLVVPRSLSQVYGAKAVDGTKVNYAFGGGFIEVRGTERDAGPVVDLARAARRGDNTLELAGDARVKPGDWVRLTMTPSRELGRHLHGGVLEPGVDTLASRRFFFDWAARVVSTDGKSVTLDRPLRVDVRPEWGAKLRATAPTVTEVGIEGLAFEFAGVPKKPHLQEEGFNAIHMRGVYHGWVQDVTILDGDNGVILHGCRNVSVVGVRFASPKRAAPSGHHALWATGASQDCLFEGFAIETEYEHDLTVEGLASGNVFASGSAVRLNLDHHRNAPFENLFTDIDAGNAGRLFASGGRGDRGPHSAARTTLWNVRYAPGTLAKLPPAEQFPLANLIGMPGYPARSDEAGFWIEPVKTLRPANLHEAQRERRLGGR